MSAQRLVLLRHGRTTSNVEGRFQGHLDVELDDVGHAQAVAVATLLADRLAIDLQAGAVRLVSSDSARAVQTAEALAKAFAVDLETDAALRERCGGKWEGLLRNEIAAAFPEEFARWIAGEDLVIGGGESLDDSWRRCEAGLRRQADAMDGGVLVVVGHGASMRGAMLRLAGLIRSVSPDPADLVVYRALQGLGNACWAEVVRRGEGWVLARYGESAADLPA